MKANKFFLGLALVGAILTACEKEPETPVATGEVSYVSVNLNYANQDTRAEGQFEFGEATENEIKDVTFFFFDEEFKAYSIEVNNNVSYKTLTPTMNQGSGHVEEISNAMLVIEKSKQTPPSYILAVVNCPTALQASLSLAELQAKIDAYNKNGDYFIMANSVYKNEATGEAMYATPLTNANFAPTADAAVAEGTPVEVYVERTAVKVRVNNFAQDGKKIFPTGIKTADDKDIYAEVIGWHVTDVNDQAYLLKNIDPTWDPTTLGLTWNDAPRYRSYWAKSVNENKELGRHPHSGNVIKAHNMAYDYYYENTTATAANRSQLVVVAAFKTYDGTTYSDVTIAEWWGVKYTLEDLKKAVANSLASELYVATETEGKYESITPDYIDFKRVENALTEDNGTTGRYWSNVVLAADKASTTFYNAQGTALKADEVKAILESIRHAKIWKEQLGGYYYLDIEHFGNKEATQYGLVRNHLYEYTLTTVKGLGTPIYDGTQIIVPEKPEDEETYIAAKLNIQAWKVVSQNNVTLQ